MRKFLAFVAIVAVALTACDKGPEEPTYTSSLSFSKLEVTFNKAGGEQTLGFAIINPMGGSVTVEENAEWMDARAEFNSDIIINVEANEGDAREATILVKYKGAKDVKLVVRQKAGNVGDYDVEYQAKRFEGIYGGKTGNTYNYYVILSDIGVSKSGEAKANGTYYYFDFYSSTAGDQEYPVLPDGTYTFDANDTHASGTFSDENSWYAVMDAAGEFATARSYKTATVTVAENSFEAVIEFTNGETHHVTYEGDLYVGIDQIYSTFTQDFEFDFKGATITATNYGDVLKNGMQNWFIEAVKGDDLFMLDIFTSSATSPAANYTKLATDTSDYNNKFIPGMMDNGLIGAWYAKVSGDSINTDVMAPIVDGLIQVTVEGGSATITYAAKDDAGNKISGSISGSYTKAEVEE